MMTEQRYQDLSRFRIPIGSRGRSAILVQLWWIFEALLVRPSPQVLYAWRRFAWRLFGAKIGRNVLIRPGARVTYPWKLSVGDHSWIGDNAVLYNVDYIRIGAHCVVSQEAYLCTGTHDFSDIAFGLVASPITLESECWVAARAFIGPGVHMDRGAVVGACSTVFRDVAAGDIVAGVPARILRTRDRGGT